MIRNQNRPQAEQENKIKPTPQLGFDLDLKIHLGTSLGPAIFARRPNEERDVSEGTLCSPVLRDHSEANPLLESQSRPGERVLRQAERLHVLQRVAVLGQQADAGELGDLHHRAVLAAL